MCGSMVDIQCAAAEIRRGKKRRKIETTGQKYNGLPYYIGRAFEDVQTYVQTRALEVQEMLKRLQLRL